MNTSNILDKENSFKLKLANENLQHFLEYNNINKFQSFYHDQIISFNIENNLNNSYLKPYKLFPLNSTLPTFVLNNEIIYSKDRILRYTAEKKEWKNKINALKKKYKQIPESNKIKTIDIKASKCIIPSYLIEFSKLLNNDPDKHFDSDYNWYLSGEGNLIFFSIRNENYIAQSINNEFYLHHFIDNFHSEQKHKFVCKNNKIIHETILSDGYIGLRQKHYIYILKLVNSENNIECCFLKSLKSEIPYTSLKIFENNLYISHIDNSIKICDLDNKNSYIINISKNELYKNQWSTIHNTNSSIFIQSTTKSVIVFDKRKENTTETLNFSPNLNCETITASHINMDETYYVYIGTNHCLNIYDIRYFSEKNNAFVKRWTHGLKSPPLYIKSISLSDKNRLIHISGQLSDESCLILNSHNDPNILPWFPPTIFDTYSLVQRKGYCLDPTNNVKLKLKASRTGCILFNINDNINLMTMNSLGITYNQVINNSIKIDEQNICNCLQTWCDKLSRKQKLIATDTVKMLRYCKEKSAKYHDDFIIKPSTFLTSNRNWNNILSSMSECTDMCADELLSFWEINIDDPNLSQSSNHNLNVESWLMKSVN